MENNNLKGQLIWFFIFLVIYTGIIFVGYANANNYFLFMNAYMWSPALAPLSALAVTRSGFDDLGLNWGKISYLFLSAVIPLGYGLIAYVIIWAFGWADFNNETLNEWIKKMGLASWYVPFGAIVYFIFRAFFGTIGNMPSSFGEELGWRGFLMPRLRTKLSYTTTSFLVGIIWAAWHFPLIIKNTTPPYLVPVPVIMVLFVAGLIGMTFIINWVTEKSGSIWPAVIMHSAHNLFILAIFDPLSKSKENSEWYVSESGIVLPFVLLALGVFFWTKRGELSAEAAK